MAGAAGWALLDYLCVSADHRNRGIGALLLSMLLEQEPDLTIFGESELPSHAPDPVMAEHRLGFYARNGAKPPGMRPLYSVCPTRRSTGPKSRWTTAC